MKELITHIKIYKLKDENTFDLTDFTYNKLLYSFVFYRQNFFFFKLKISHSYIRTFCGFIHLGWMINDRIPRLHKLCTTRFSPGQIHSSAPVYINTIAIASFLVTVLRNSAPVKVLPPMGQCLFHLISRLIEISNSLKHRFQLVHFPSFL